MAYSDLLIHDIVVKTPTTSISVDAYNNPVPGTTSNVSEKARIQLKPVQNSADEIMTGRDTRIGNYDFFGDKDSTITSLSTIVWGSRTFRVDGDPEVVDGRYGPHHTEASLQEITGA